MKEEKKGHECRWEKEKEDNVCYNNWKDLWSQKI